MQYLLCREAKARKRNPAVRNVAKEATQSTATVHESIVRSIDQCSVVVAVLSGRKRRRAASVAEFKIAEIWGMPCNVKCRMASVTQISNVLTNLQQPAPYPLCARGSPCGQCPMDPSAQKRIYMHFANVHICCAHHGKLSQHADMPTMECKCNAYAGNKHVSPRRCSAEGKCGTSR